MYRSVIVPLDGSASAESALGVAVGLANRTGLPLHLVRVEPSSSTRSSFIAATGHATVAAARARASAYVSEVAIRLAETGVSGAIVSALLEGPVVREIVAYGRREAGLLVMTPHGSGSTGRGSVGAVADRLVRWSKLPVFLVPPEHSAGPDPSWRCDRILLALDGQDLPDGVLDPVLALGEAFQAVVTIASPSGGMALEPVSRGRDSLEAPGSFGEASARLVGMAVQRLRARGCEVGVRSLNGRLDARTVLDLAAQLDADLIVMATADRADGSLLRHGSPLSRTLRRSTVPVLIRCGKPGPRLPVDAVWTESHARPTLPIA